MSIMPGFDLLLEVDAEAAAAREQRVGALVEDEDDRLLAAPGRRDAELRGDGRLAGAGAADDQRAGAFLDAAAEQRVELADAPTASLSQLPRPRCSAATSRGNTARPPLPIR